MPRDDASTVREAIDRLDRNVVNALRKLRPASQEKAGVEAGGDGADLHSYLRTFFPKVSHRLSQGLQVGGAITGALKMGGAVAAGEGAAALGSNPVGWALGLASASVALTAAFVALPSIVHTFADSLIDSNRSLGQWSAAMAIVLAGQDVRNIFRDIRRGELLASSVNSLVQANSRLKDSTLGLEVMFEKIKNSLTEAIVHIAEIPFRAAEKHPRAAGVVGGALFGGLIRLPEGVDKGLAFLDKILGKLGLIDDNTKKDELPIEPMSDFFNRVAEAGKEAIRRNDPRFGRAMGVQ